MEGTSQGHPWWLWVLVVIGAGATLVTLAFLLTGAWLVGALMPQRTEDAVCTQRLATECTHVTPDAIGRVTEMTLPPGTTVESSRYDEFQDWSLQAVFVIPAEQVPVWEASLTRYPEPAAEGCTGLEGRGSHRLCASGGSMEDPPWRSYTRATQPDGSVVVEVEVFST